MKNYKIAIIIPNYNNEKYIEKCLNSIYKQIYTNYEVIFIDDMSSDDSVKVAMENLRPQDKLVTLRQKRFIGGARNEGYLYVSDDVDYIYYIDGDDWLYNNYALKKINNGLQSEPDVLFVGIAKYSEGVTTPYFNPDYKDKYDCLLGWSGACGMVVKKELALKQNCLFKENTLKEDKNHHYRICLNMKTFKNLQDYIYVWNRDNLQSTTHVRNRKWEISTLHHYADMVELMDEYEDENDKRLTEILRTRELLILNEILSNKHRQW